MDLFPNPSSKLPALHVLLTLATSAAKSGKAEHSATLSYRGLAMSSAGLQHQLRPGETCNTSCPWKGLVAGWSLAILLLVKPC